METFMDWQKIIHVANNPYFPLPGDYAELSLDGQRQARLSVLCDQTTLFKLVMAWHLFRQLYLGGTQNAVFYRNGLSISPDFHFDMIYDLGRYARNAWAAPRGSAKSTVLIEAILLLALTRPFYDMTLGLSTDRQVEGKLDQLMIQFQTNELILQDFGEMQPKRGQALWNHHHMHLTNGTIIQGLSVMGKKRGGRPKLFGLDDPENDPDSDSETSRMAVIEKFEMILFKQIIPMLESGSSIFWVGTLIDRKSFLYQATTGSDPRFDFWNRKVLRAIAHDKDDPKKVYILWPAKWPEDVLEARLGEIGPSAFASEYCNEPVSVQDRLLVVDPRKNEYSVDGEFNWQNPLSYTGKIHWQDRIINAPGEHRVYKEMEKPYADLVRPMYRVLLFDYAYGMSSYNDYSCIDIVGFDTAGTMWVLFSWLGRAKEDTLMRLIYETGLAWRPRVLGIEAVGIQKTFAESVQAYISEQGERSGDSWRARIFPVTYPAKESKGQRIASLEWRFNSGRIKYPAHLAGVWPYDQLYAQTADFTIDLALLQHDDALDTVAMSKYVVKTKGGILRREREQPSLLERIKKNMPIVSGTPVLSGVPSAEISDEMMNVLSQMARRRNTNNRNRRIERPHPKIIT